MNAYSLDLREQMVEAKERGWPTVEVTRAFGADLILLTVTELTDAAEGKAAGPRQRSYRHAASRHQQNPLGRREDEHSECRTLHC